MFLLLRYLVLQMNGLSDSADTDCRPLQFNTAAASRSMRFNRIKPDSRIEEMVSAPSLQNDVSSQPVLSALFLHSSCKAAASLQAFLLSLVIPGSMRLPCLDHQSFSHRTRCAKFMRLAVLCAFTTAAFGTKCSAMFKLRSAATAI